MKRRVLLYLDGMNPDESYEAVPIELMDLELEVRGIQSPADEQALRQKIGAHRGIVEIEFAENVFALVYDPTLTNRKAIEHEILGAGYTLGRVTSEAASPLTDSQNRQQNSRDEQ